jgi:hypothetical protein
MTVLKVETDIIGSITVSQIGRAVILVIIYVEILKTGVIVFSVLNVSMWCHTDRYVPVLDLVGWYWKYPHIGQREHVQITDI